MHRIGRLRVLKAASYLLCLALITTPAYAVRCGNKIIRTGDTAEKVLRNCGRPFKVDNRTIYRDPFVTSADVLQANRSDDERRGSREVWVETWYYNFGNNKLTRMIRIDNGIVTDIQTGSYGN